MTKLKNLFNLFNSHHFVTSAFLIAVIYWTYLSLASQFVIIYDSIGYEQLGQTLANNPISKYFHGAPNREILYPLSIALSIKLGGFLNISYLDIQETFQILCLITTLFLLRKIFDHLKISHIIQSFIILYLGFSPSFNGTAFSLLSEVITLPLTTAFVLVSLKTHLSIKTNNYSQIIRSSITLGILLFLLTSVKAVFELTVPLYLLLLGSSIFIFSEIKSIKKHKNQLISLLITFIIFQFLIIGYKATNYYFNGNFTLTNRGSWALYGNTKRRTLLLQWDNLKKGIVLIAGENLCIDFYGEKACEYWSYRLSDDIAYGKMSELNATELKEKEINKTFYNLTIDAIKSNPLQYTLLTFLESFKMFFWETPNNFGFFMYQKWVDDIYANKKLHYSLNFIWALTTFIAFIYSSIFLFNLKIRNTKTFCILINILCLIIPYIGLYSFFHILPRYATPLIPLYMVLIACTLNHIISLKHTH